MHRSGEIAEVQEGAKGRDRFESKSEGVCIKKVSVKGDKRKVSQVHKGPVIIRDKGPQELYAICQSIVIIWECRVPGYVPSRVTNLFRY